MTLTSSSSPINRWTVHSPVVALGCAIISVLPVAVAVDSGTSPAVGSAARGPRLGGYTGICLGGCFDCHSLLEALPRWPRLSAAQTHTDPTRFSAEELQAFFSAPEVCNIRELYPVSVDREVWSLAALVGGHSQLRFPGAASQIRLASSQCSVMIELSAGAFAEARRSVSTCSAGSPGDGGSRCRREAVLRALVAFQKRWLSEATRLGGPTIKEHSEVSLEDGPWVVEVDFGFAGNETGLFVNSFASRVGRLLQQVMEEAAAQPNLITGRLLDLPLGDRVSEVLTGLAVELSKMARGLIEHVRTVWGIKDLTLELGGVFPQIRQQLPVFRFHPSIYGRHWDVLEWLLDGLVPETRGVSEKAAANEAPLRMVELGVACGPIGYHLLPRFPSLRYFGADPTIPPEVREAYLPYTDRAQLVSTTSKELHLMLPESEPLDFVFIDGPHTYKNVRNDLELWVPRVRSGGIIAGHDFTCAHPPLLWAVSEFRRNMGGTYLNVGMDGVWWWRAD